MSSEDLEHYAQRAIFERRRVKDAPTPEIAEGHERLADLYEALIRKMVAAQETARDLERHTHQP